MKKSKTILLSKLIVFLFLITLINTAYCVQKEPFSYYSENTKVISGEVTEITKIDDGYKLILKAKEKIIVYYYDKLKIKLGNQIKVTGTVKKPKKNTVFNLFNYQNYLKSQKIYWQMTADNIKVIDKDEGLYIVKNKLLSYLQEYKSYKYLNAFILGIDDDISDKIYESYQINGISHLLAISGSQITILSLILLFILNIFFKNKNFNYLLVIFLLLFYMFLTGFLPPIVRATLLFVILTINKIIKLEVKTIYLLLLIASGYLLYNPFMIMNIGFLFSFIICFYLILFKDYFSKTKGYLLKTFVISLIAFLASMPILIYNFHYINLLSPFINLIFVPLVSLVIYPLSLILLLVKPLDDFFFNLCICMENLSLYISNVDNYIIILKHIDIYMIFFYYLLITLVIYKMSQKNYFSFLILVCVLLLHTNVNYFNKQASLTMIDVGQGDSFFLALPHNKGNILIDTGGELTFDQKPYDLSKNIILPYLKSEGVKSLDYLIITHGDYDHMGEAINLVNNFKVDKVIFNCGEFNELEQDLIKVLDKKKIPYYSCIKELNIDDNKLYFLNNKDYGNENDNSSVIYTKLNSHKFLFMGDAGVEVEEDLIEKYNIQDIDVLKVGHHGSKTSTGKEFVGVINPKYSIISVGKNNRYGHPNDSVLQNLNDSKIYRTDQDGSIMFKIKNNKLEIETCAP